MKYDEKAIAKAQKELRAQDEETFGKEDAVSMAKRKEALLNLLRAHIPIWHEDE